MAIASLESSSNTQTDQNPLLMERIESNSDLEHIVDITRTHDASSTSSHDANPSTETLRSVDRPSSGTETSSRRTALSSSTRSNSRSSSFVRRGDGYGHRHRSPLNSGLWISVELVVTVSQIIASFVVLCLARSENPQAPLFAWIVGYASGCIATLPVLYWRFRNRNQSLEQESTHTHQGTSQSNPPEPTSYAAISVSQSSDEENNHATETVGRNGQIAGTLSTRINGLVDHFKMALDCFFAVWFVVGNVWIFGGHSSPADAPKLYRLCIVFLTFSCIGYAMPFILCATICCCLPCIISVLGIREDHSQARGATAEAISALPTYKFKLTKHGSEDNQEAAAKGEDGILAAGTEKERLIPGEDAVCCICLAKYTDDDELRELPCIHVFHMECVDKWLKINASCPLCKYEVGESDDTSQFTRDSSHSQQ